jgi:hypothetical protein
MRSARRRTAKKRPTNGKGGTALVAAPVAERDGERVANRKPGPLFSPRLRKHCPVCGEIAYSAAGIHPQCAMHAADAKRTKRIKRMKSVQKPRMTATDATDIKPWHRVCPKCKAVVHIRRRICSCGNRFSTAKPPSK